MLDAAYEGGVAFEWAVVGAHVRFLRTWTLAEFGIRSIRLALPLT